MKKILTAIVLLSTAFTIRLFAQNIGSGNNNFEAHARIWLQNSEGKRITSSGDTLFSRDFFQTQWVAVHCSRVLNKDESITIVFQPPAGNMARAYRLNNNRLSEEALTQIRKTPSPTILTVMMSAKNGAMPTKEAFALQIILK